MSERTSPEQAQGWLDAYKSKDFEERLQAGAYIDEMAVDMAHTIVAVGRVADLLDQMAEDNRLTAAQITWAAPGAKGREHAYNRAAEFIREAIGDTK